MLKKIATFLFVFAGVCSGQDAGVESIFDQGAGGRAMGLAGAFSAVADDSSAVYWNPAGLGYVQTADVSPLFVFFPRGTVYNSFSAVYPSIEFGTLAAGFLRVGTGDIVTRDNRNVVLETGTASGQAEFLFAYGRQIPRLPFSLGMAMKVNSFQVGEVSDANFSLDAGILIRAYGPDWDRLLGRWRLQNLTMGLCFKDILSTPMKLDTVQEGEPFNIKWGAAWHGLVRGNDNHRILASMDLGFYRYKPPKLAVGVEYNLYRMFFIRTGYSMASGFGLGAGIFHSFSGHRFRLDYGIGLQEFGPVHRISLLYQFGRSVEERLDDQRRELDRSLKVKIDQAVEDERKANETRLREIETKFSNSQSEIRKEAELKYSQMLEQQVRDQEATNKAQEQRINEESRRKLEKILSETTNTIGQQNRAKIEEVKKQLEKERLEQLQQTNLKAVQKLTNQRRQLELQQKDEIARKVNAEKIRSDQEKKKAVLEEQKKGAERVQKITAEQKVIRQDMLRAQDTLFEAEDFEAAIRILEDILKRDPANLEAKEYLDRARGARTSPADYPQEVKDAVQLGVQLATQNKYDEAVQVWQKALDKYPNNWRLFKLIRDTKKKQPPSSGTGQAR